MSAEDNLNRVAKIKKKLAKGDITYDEAKEQVQVVVDAINAKGREIAKKHGMRPRLVSAVSILR